MIEDKIDTVSKVDKLNEAFRQFDGVINHIRRIYNRITETDEIAKEATVQANFSLAEIMADGPAYLEEKYNQINDQLNNLEERLF